jgi:urease accessory protein
VIGAALSGIVPALQFIEPAIALSVILLGALLLAPRRIDPRAGLALIAASALLHGYAHGAEMAGASFVAYASGFALASAGLHAVGLGAGAWMQRTRAWIWNAAATLVGASGVVLLAARL